MIQLAVLHFGVHPLPPSSLGRGYARYLCVRCAIYVTAFMCMYAWIRDLFYNMMRNAMCNVDGLFNVTFCRRNHVANTAYACAIVNFVNYINKKYKKKLSIWISDIGAIIYEITRDFTLTRTHNGSMHNSAFKRLHIKYSSEYAIHAQVHNNTSPRFRFHFISFYFIMRAYNTLYTVTIYYTPLGCA